MRLSSMGGMGEVCPAMVLKRGFMPSPSGSKFVPGSGSHMARLLAWGAVGGEALVTEAVLYALAAGLEAVVGDLPGLEVL